MINFVYSDRMRGDGEDLGTVHYEEWQRQFDEWKVSYRKTTPEKNPLNVDLLRRRLEHQKAFKTNVLGIRRNSWLQAHWRKEKKLAKQRVKYSRKKAVLAINLADSDNSSSSSIESED